MYTSIFTLLCFSLNNKFTFSSFNAFSNISFSKSSNCAFQSARADSWFVTWILIT